MEREERRINSAGFVTALFAVALVLNFSAVPFAEAREEQQLDTITVTAQKQEENIQEVPVSISVFTEVDIEDRKIESVQNLADFVPNFSILQHGASGFNAPTMRGLSGSIESLTVSTGLFVDGVPILNPNGFEEGMIDVERIEVLRGPQGTLYGKGTETGAVNIITRQPDNEFRAKVSAEGGKLLSYEAGDGLLGSVALDMSGPIVKDTFYFGISGKYEQRDGFIENTLTNDSANDRSRWEGRAKLRWTPMEKLDILLTASHLKNDLDGDNMNLGDVGSAMFMLPVPEYRKVSSNGQGSRTSENDSQSLKITYDISEPLTLTSISTNWLHKRDNENMDLDYNPITLNHMDSSFEFHNISQEFRLNYSAKRLKWLAGFYYDYTDNDVDFEITSMIPMMSGLTSRNTGGNTYAVFTNITYPLVEQLNLVAGLRYEKEEKDFENKISDFKLDESWDELTPKIALEYNFTPEIMSYISVAKGYRSGGFNVQSNNPQFYSYDQEKLWSYEIGAKSTFLDNRLIVNGAIYYMDISDMQVSEAISPYENYLTNAAEATGIGFEVETTARISDGLSLMAGFGYTDIEFDKFSDLLGNYDGNKNPYAPEYSFNIGAQYRHPSGFYARADLMGYGDMYLDKANKYIRDAYEIVNAKVGYEMKNFDVYLYAKNLFDKEYDSENMYDGFFTIYSEPGEIGLQLVYRF